MADISIGAAVGEGFGLIRRKPLTVLAWGLLQAVFFGAAFALIGPLLAANVNQIVAQSQATPGAPPSAQAMQNMMQTQSVVWLFDMISLVVGTVTYCAVFRAVIHPERRRFAYLRLGAPELLMILVLFGMAIALGIGMFVIALVVGLLVGIFMLFHATIVGGLLAAVAGIATFVAMIYVALRICLIGPMMVDDGKFHLDEAWRLTRGKVWSLFAVGLLIVLLLFVAEIVISLLVAIVGFGALATMAGGLANLPTLFRQSPGLVMTHMLPWLAGLGLLMSPLAGALLAIMAAPWARAYLDLRPRRDIAETFA